LVSFRELRVHERAPMNATHQLRPQRNVDRRGSVLRLIALQSSETD
jgi:hypothetical protein